MKEQVKSPVHKNTVVNTLNLTSPCHLFPLPLYPSPSPSQLPSLPTYRSLFLSLFLILSFSHLLILSLPWQDETKAGRDYIQS